MCVGTDRVFQLFSTSACSILSFTIVYAISVASPHAEHAETAIKCEFTGCGRNSYLSYGRVIILIHTRPRTKIALELSFPNNFRSSLRSSRSGDMTFRRIRVIALFPPLKGTSTGSLAMFPRIHGGISVKSLTISPYPPRLIFDVVGRTFKRTRAVAAPDTSLCGCFEAQII